MPSPKPGAITSVEDPRYVKATGHPLRLRILAMLAERNLTPVQLSKELGTPLNKTAYHVRVLDDLGLLDLVDETRARGAIAHHYRARPLPKQPEGAWGEAAAAVKQSAVGSELAHIGQRAATAAASGAFDDASAVLERRELRLAPADLKRLDRALTRFQSDLDKLAQTAEGEPRTVVTMIFAAASEAHPAKGSSRRRSASKR